MYTVVIVDDEPWALQGLAEIIDWNNEGFSIIGQFTDPDEAFEFLCKKEPDVVFTDIRMPGLSGLDLIEMSRVKGLNCEFVLISSYEDFEAAQKGIRLHVWEYILKPYNAEDIHSVIKVLSLHLEKRNDLVSVEWNDCAEEILRKGGIASRPAEKLPNNGFVHLLSSMRRAGGVERRKVDSFCCQRHRGCISESICRIPYV